MNKSQLLSLLGPYLVTKNALTDTDSPLENVTTNLQGAQKTDIVFYKVNLESEASFSAFNKRLESSAPGLIILNHEAEKIKNNNCLFIESGNFLKVQKLLLDVFYPYQNKMKIVGVTGTNGKTTTVNLAMQMSSMSGHPAVSIGTIGVQDVSGIVIDDLESTTPSYVELRKLLHRFQDKYETCFMEVSSHALAQDRLFDIKLDAAAWTSFSQDHLDYHQSMQDYFAAKLLIEKKYLKENKKLIIPAAEKELYEMILRVAPGTRIKIAKTLDERGFSRSVEDRPLFYHSAYNQSNAEVAMELNEELCGREAIAGLKLAGIKTPPGRFSVIEMGNEKLAIVDYAHTPDALTNIGNAIKNAFPGYKLTVVFGCGGNRDKTKRPLMGKAVSDFADKVIVTSDNPRNEAPEDIIMDILPGINGGYEAVIDRKKAIHAALESMTKKEIILIAGKGHEEYQEIKGVKHPFSDFNVVTQFKAGS